MTKNDQITDLHSNPQAIGAGHYCKLQIANCKLQIGPARLRQCAPDPLGAAVNLQFAICNLQFAIACDSKKCGKGRKSPLHHSPLTTRRSRTAAFTLVESLMVVVLLAILASVLVPVLGNPATTRLKGAATVLSRHIEYVQSEAMNTGQILQINFVNRTQYQVVDPDGGVGGSAILLRHPQLDYPAHDGQFVVDFDDPGPLHGTTIQSIDFGGQRRLEFGKYGEPTSGGEIVLRSGSHQVRISVAPVTGMVAVGDLEVALGKTATVD